VNWNILVTLKKIKWDNISNGEWKYYIKALSALTICGCKAAYKKKEIHFLKLKLNTTDSELVSWEKVKN